jgi:hypothetical protein
MTDDGRPTGQRHAAIRPMTAEQVVREIRIIRHSTQALRIGRRVPGIRTIARHAGLSFRTVYTIAQTGHITDVQAIALASALKAVQELR